MDAVLLRSKLHDYIEQADERHLEAIYTLVEANVSEAPAQYDAATMDMLHERRSAHLSGASRSYTAEESLQLIRSGKR